MLGNVQSLSIVLTGISMGTAVKFGINTTSVALKMGKISQGELLTMLLLVHICLVFR